MDGKSGGSGGGGGAGANASAGAVGQGKTSLGEYAVDNATKGNNGGKGGTAGTIYSADGGGGGGGAESAGVTASPSTGGTGGNPWKVDGTSDWIKAAAGITDVNANYEFSRGGDGGKTDSTDGGTPGQYYGDGGSAGKNTVKKGGDGHGGIVVIRFQRPKLDVQ
jgi:hypothetical protein